MTIINHSLSFTFIHVPKAAGTSLSIALSAYSNYCDIEIGGTELGQAMQAAYRKRFGLAKHATAPQIRQVIGAETWAKHFKFAFVRNPFARCLSTYHFLKKWHNLDAQFVNKLQSFNSFEDYVLSDMWETSNGPDQLFRPQTHWLCANQNSTDVLVDFVGHVETIDADLKTILDTIGIPDDKRQAMVVPQLNKSKQSALAEIKNEEVIYKILTKYKLDFDAFCYPTTCI